jgi:hypothetical protein
MLSDIGEAEIQAFLGRINRIYSESADTLKLKL